MLKHRIIPCVLLKDWQLVKSTQFGFFRTIGHPTSTARIYNARDVDELIVLDIDASLKNDEINTEIITDIANECFMPLTIGGGINTIEDIYKVLSAGADKISINTKAIEDLNFIKKASSIFGSQCIVCSIDVKKVDNQYMVYNKIKGILEINPVELALKYEEYGAGEILLTSVDHEGSTKGYDLELIKLFKDKLKIPIILNGGMGKPIHAVEAIKNGADAIAAAYIFHFSKYTPNDIKKEMNYNNILVRKFND
ncbi:imidazole glycerol phosphate synthase cyclase subunit [Aliarcobacter butzleri]|uniref:imidazole glycerol phosphate synthase cyclase subunit n=1 Tax=Aliarcobacter butzleri TaxID=28197 RepID=UPI00263D4224|nr:imidazole glycerol phosphate synthase cyclase subunit [Aliarcobacter butzleri]MDN5126625.1 imidazole glycerol phosphate synthase cyclase subunit [Aliarcobacter butzleri]